MHSLIDLQILLPNRPKIIDNVVEKNPSSYRNCL
jgi:hypothetical protein